MHRKWLKPVIVMAAVAVAIPVTLNLLHRGNVSADNATLTIHSGSVLVMKTGADAWTGAVDGTALKRGDSIKTGDNSTAEITFLDGSTIDLEANTQIDILSLEISTDTGSKTISLKQTIGNTISRVTELVDTASSYEVETPSCVAAVRGSAMGVNITADGTTCVTNLEGDVWVIASGVELQVPLGRTCIVTPGQTPELLPPSDGSDGGRK